jgi:hypothetical protein
MAREIRKKNDKTSEFSVWRAFLSSLKKPPLKSCRSEHLATGADLVEVAIGHPDKSSYADPIASIRSLGRRDRPKRELQK